MAKDNSRFKKFFKVMPDDSLIVRDGLYVEVRLAREFLDVGAAEIIGKDVVTFGLFTIHVWNFDESGKYPDSTRLDKIRMTLPTLVRTAPNLINNTAKAVTLSYMGGDKLIVSTLLQKTVSTLSKFIDLVFKGKMPDDISYTEIIDYWTQCYKLNGVKLGTQYVFLDAMVMVVARWKDNPAKQFREYLRDNPKASMLERHMVNMDIIPSLTSQFSAMTASNARYGLTSTIGAVKSGELKPTSTDLESAIT